MKEQALRIGNLVYDDVGKIIEVDSIGYGGVNLAGCDANFKLDGSNETYYNETFNQLSNEQ